MRLLFLALSSITLVTALVAAASLISVRGSTLQTFNIPVSEVSQISERVSLTSGAAACQGTCVAVNAEETLSQDAEEPGVEEEDELTDQSPQAARTKVAAATSTPTPGPGPSALSGQFLAEGRTIRLRWSPMAAAVQYSIYVSMEKGGPYELLGTAPTGTYSHNRIETGKTYYYVVKAVRKDQRETQASRELAVRAFLPNTTPIAKASPTATRRASTLNRPPSQSLTPTITPTPARTVAPTSTLIPTATPTPTPTSTPVIDDGAPGDAGPP